VCNQGGAHQEPRKGLGALVKASGNHGVPVQVETIACRSSAEATVWFRRAGGGERKSEDGRHERRRGTENDRNDDGNKRTDLENTPRTQLQGIEHTAKQLAVMKQMIVGDGEHEPKKDEICNLCTQICKNSRVLESIVLEFESLEFEVSVPSGRLLLLMTWIYER